MAVACMVVETTIHATADEAAVSSDSITADERLDPSFVRASLLLASPGEAFYSVFGHSAIRMECPAYGLDNVFTFEVDIEGGLADYFFNRAPARLAAVPASDYIGTYVAEGRSVAALTLNLTPREKQELWRWLDMMSFEAPSTTFNQRRRNCLSVSVERIGKAVSPSLIVPPPEFMAMTNGDMMNASFGDASQWNRIGYLIAAGASADQYDHVPVLPTLMAADYAGWTIRDADGSSRPLFAGGPVLLTPPARPLRHSPLTPAVVAVAVGLMSVAMAVVSRRGRAVDACRVVAVVLMALLAVVWAGLVFLAAVPNTVTAPWSWFMVVFNPVPVIGWTCFRRRRWFAAAVRIYGAVQIIFALVSPVFTSQANLPLSILAGAFGISLLIIKPQSISRK